MSLLRLCSGDALLLGRIIERHQRADRHFTYCQPLLRVKFLSQPETRFQETQSDRLPHLGSIAPVSMR